MSKFTRKLKGRERLSKHVIMQKKSLSCWWILKRKHFNLDSTVLLTLGLILENGILNILQMIRCLDIIVILLDAVILDKFGYQGGHITGWWAGRELRHLQS